MSTVVRLRVVDEDGRSAAQRSQELHRARDQPESRARLEAVLAPLHKAQRLVESALERRAQTRSKSKSGAAANDATLTVPAGVWPLLDEAYAALDVYLAHLLHTAAIDPACAPRCSACCTDLPPILPIEALRMLRALRRDVPERAPKRIQRAVELARAFQRHLHQSAGGVELLRDKTLDTSAPSYREAQIGWRRLGHPCPILGDDGNCSQYADRPLSCRAHVHVEDPAHCEPQSPRFLIAERPPLWGHVRECEVEVALASLGKLLGLPGVPNLHWGMAQLHGHPSAR